VAVLDQHPGELAVRIPPTVDVCRADQLLIHRNSPESRDSDDEMQQALNRIEKRLKALEGEGGKAKAASS
jgi:hypothetical protein